MKYLLEKTVKKIKKRSFLFQSLNPYVHQSQTLYLLVHIEKTLMQVAFAHLAAKII